MAVGVDLDRELGEKYPAHGRTGLTFGLGKDQAILDRLGTSEVAHLRPFNGVTFFALKQKKS